jgi:phospholipase/carboxylesterase
MSEWVSEEAELFHIAREPAETRAAGTNPLLVLIHGYGSNEEDLMGLAPYLDRRFQIVSVRAPLQLGPGRYSWFSLDVTSTGLTVDHDESISSHRRLTALIPRLQEHYSADPKSTFLLGFSQGATMAVAAGLVDSLASGGSAGVVSLSGVCVPELIPQPEEVEALRGKPFLMTHGRADGVVPIEAGRAFHRRLEPLSLDLVYKEYDMGHEINQECLADLAAWLQGKIEKRLSA